MTTTTPIRSTTKGTPCIINYPLMANFIGGAFSANSGGKIDPFAGIRGEEEEWDSAECQLKDLCSDVDHAYHMGQLADDGGRYLFQMPDIGDFEAEFGQHGPMIRIGDTDYVVAMPYVILDRYY